MATIDCIPRDTLKQYLAGWVNEPEAADIEQHLQRCEDCEQTVVELEKDPETLLESLRQTDISRAPQTEGDSMLQEAVARAEHLIVPLTPSVTTGPQAFPDVLGPYQLLRRLGHGGMGAVYLAKHKKLDKHVAIKLLPGLWAANEEAAARFHREILAVGKLNHDAIVSATDAGEQDGVHYLVMEYVEGIDLSQLARVTGPLKIADACELMRQVARGLAYAHAEGIVHRDVKPSNIMLNGRGQVKVLDFGLAQLHTWDGAAAELTSVGQLMGTLDYMAPEQAERANSVDYRADLYSLGATLFRLLAGRAPLAAAPSLSPLEKLRLLSEHNPPRLDTLRPDAPPELVQLVGSLLSRHPDARPASAAHVAEQLAPFCTGADLQSLPRRASAAAQELASSIAPAGSLPWPVVVTSALPDPRRAAIRGGWGTLTAFLILAVLVLVAGVLIVLDTRKGQLVIESEVPGVHVKLLSDGKVVEELQVDTGATSTRLAADQYEIVLDSRSDSLTIDKREVIVKNGSTVIARIRQRGDSEVPGRDGPAPSEVAGAVYEGKSLDEWLNQLSRERSGTAIEESLQALEALLDEHTGDRITQALIEWMPKVSSVVTAQRSDQLAFRILARANPGQRYYELLARMLATEDLAFQKRILTVGVWQTPRATTEELEPLLNWIENLLVAAADRATNRELVEAAGDCVLGLLTADRAVKYDISRIESRLLPLMERSLQHSAGYWLRGLPRPKWSLGLRNAIARVAIDVLQDPAETAQNVTQAAICLQHSLTNPAVEVELDRSLVAKAVQARLDILAGNEERLLEMTDLETEFLQSATPNFSVSMGIGTPKDARGSEALEVLDLIAALPDRAPDEFKLEFMIQATRDAYVHVAQFLAPATPRYKPTIVFHWPALDAFNIQGARQGLIPTITPTQALGYIICTRAAEVGNIPLPEVSQEESPFPPALDGIKR